MGDATVTWDMVSRGDATYNAWAWQQHLALATQRHLARQAAQATATMSMTVTDHHKATTTMDPAMDEANQAILDRAKARAKAKKAARADPLAAKTIESTPARNPLAADTTARDPHPIVVPSHNPTDKFAPVQAPVVPSATSTPLCPTTRPEPHSPWDSTLHTDYKTVEDEAPQDAATRVMGLSVNPLMGTWDDPTKTIGDVGDTSTSLINFTAKNNEFMIDQLKTTIDGSNSDEHTARFEDENQQSTRGWADVIEEKSPPPAPTEFNAETAETTARKTAERPPKVNQATCSLSHLRIRSGLYLLFKTLAHPSGLLALQDTRASGGLLTLQDTRASGGLLALQDTRASGGLLALQDTRASGGLLTLQDIPASERATCSPSHPRVRAGYLLFEPPGHPSGLLALPATSMGSDAIEKSKEGKSDLDTGKDLNFNDEDDSSKCITHLQDEKELDTEEWTAIIEDYHSTDRNDVVVTMGDGMQLQAQYVLCKKILECLYQWDNLTPAIVKYPTELGTLTPSNGPAAGIQLGASEYDADIYSYNDEAMNGPCNLPVFNSFTDEPTTRVVSY